MRVAWVIKLSPPAEVGPTPPDLPHQERGSWSSRDATAPSHDGPTTWAFATREVPTEHRTYNFLLMSGSFVHKIIIAGCRCFASPLPSGPHQEGHHAEGRSARSAGSLAIGLSPRPRSCIALRRCSGVTCCSRRGGSRSEEATSSTPSSSRPAGSASTASTIALVKQAEITSRLRDILKARDRALLARDAQLLSDIYTIDCKCLEDGRALIRQLRKENVVWKGVSTNITIESTEKVNDRLWIVVATVRTPPVRIETEAGRLVRIVPSERNRVRFALAKPTNEEEWLLGHASSLS